VVVVVDTGEGLTALVVDIIIGTASVVGALLQQQHAHNTINTTVIIINPTTPPTIPAM